MRLLGVALVVIAAVLVVALVVYLITSALRRSANPNRDILREHNKLMIKAARASKQGKDGEANVYQESADDLMELIRRE